MRSYRRNADDRIRRLERAAAQGDPRAQLAVDRELWRTGQAISHYSRLLLDDFIEDLRVHRGAGLSDEYSEIVLPDLEGDPVAWSPALGERAVTTSRLIASARIAGGEGHTAQLMIPGRGRPYGFMLSMLVLDSKRRWARASRRTIQDVARIVKAGGVAPLSTEIRVCVALAQPKDPFDGTDHPLFFFHRNNERWSHHAGARPRESLAERWLPPRMFCSSILAADMDSYENALTAIERALAESFEDMNIRLGWAEQILKRTTKSAGSLNPVDVRRYVAGLRGDSRGHMSAIESLQSAFGPVIGEDAPGFAKPTIRAWNIAGDGMLEAAILTLADWLVRNESAVIQEVRADPYNRESGWFSRAYMSVTSRRARRTNNPVTFEVDWDRMNGAWRHKGESWVGNELPPGGLWKISMAGSPATAADMVRPAEQWIRSVFPDARIMVAAWVESGTYGRPAYREST